jgi:hypothetical protein
MGILQCMELILTCHECGYEERGSEERMLITKVRMLNHINRLHPEVTEPFKDLVEEELSVARGN